MKLDKSFYLQNALDAARELIGKILVCDGPDGKVSGLITETEAYMGLLDRASHCYGNRGKSGRTAVMYREGGYAYVYLIYGMYHCLNVAVNAADVPECVLFRAVRPLEGLELMRKRRPGVPDKKLCDGPGKLCRAFGVDMRHYGADMTGDEIYIEDRGFSSFGVETGKRINMGNVGEAADYPYRFSMIGGNGN